jgi:drug/metabolite transporter (DMT)-like permease
MMVIFNTYQMIATLLAYLLLGEPIYKYEIVSLIICFGGIILFAYSKSLETPTPEEIALSEQVSMGAYLFGIGSILLTAVCYAVVVPLVKKMREIHYTVIVIWVNIVSLIAYSFYGIFELLFLNVERNYSALALWSVLGAGILLSVAQIFGVQA